MTATWRQSIVETHGACTQSPHPQAWDLPDDVSALTAENRLAIRICRTRCPVQAACALEALTAPEYPWGTIRAGEPLRGSHYVASPISLARLRAVADGGDS